MVLQHTYTRGLRWPGRKFEGPLPGEIRAGVPQALRQLYLHLLGRVGFHVRLTEKKDLQSLLKTDEAIEVPAHSNIP